jgi:RimJ/RimL family protein N-acetyltransferase
MDATEPLRAWNRLENADGILLRAVTMGDAEEVFAIHGDPRVYELDPDHRHRDVRHSREFLRPQVQHWAAYGFGYWAVLVPRELWEDGPAGTGDLDGNRVFAGMGGIQHHAVAGLPVLNVYFRLAPEVHGHGIARRIVEASIETADEVAPGVDLVVRTRPANAAARRVAVRAGFVDEGLEPGTTDMQLLRLVRHRPAPFRPGAAEV